MFQRIDIKEKSIQDGIENDSAFYGYWKFEPTVSSMLVVLKSIQDEFKNITSNLPTDEKMKKAKEFLQQVNDGALFFDWCSIQASDNIYIKMNGRGKPLSAFDNFKNTLYSELNKLRKIEQESGNEPLSVTIFDKKAKAFLNWVQKPSPYKRDYHNPLFPLFDYSFI